MNARRSFSERLSERRALVGLLQSLPNPLLAEMAGMCGYDFLLLDGEHGVFSQHDFLQTVQALAATEALAMVRLPGHDEQAIGRYLDMGAQAIVAPNVSTVEEAKALVRAMEYPPAGTRGVGAALHRVTRYGLDLTSHLKSPREGAWMIVIIESALGVSNVEEILSVAGIDGALIGPADLSANLGCAGDYSQPAYADAFSRIERAAHNAGKIVGTAPHAGYPVEALLARGHRLLISGADMPLIREALSAQIEKMRSTLDASPARRPAEGDVPPQ